MDDLNKDKIDALFQEGSERYDFTYREDAWASMDEMLDQQDKERKRRFMGWWLVVGLVAMMGIFGLKYYSSNHEVVVQTNPSEQNIATTNVHKDIEEALIAADKVETSKNVDQTLIPTKTQNESIEKTKSVDTKTEVIPTTDFSKRGNNKIIENNKNSLITTSTSANSDQVIETKVQEKINQEVVSINPKKVLSQEPSPLVFAGQESVNIKQGNQVVLLPSPKNFLLESKNNYLLSIQLSAITLEKNHRVVEVEQPKLRNRFSFGISAGPEFSFVGGTGEAKAGYYLGLELGYQISTRFEVIAGIGVSQKRYLGDGASYQTEPGFWTDEIVPMEFAGKCTVIEIPLAVNYYFKDINENGWFTSLGATTYLMSNEWYDFIYDPSINRTDLKMSWTDQMANNHLLGVGQISFGYQHKFGKHTSLQISPYAKIPLTGIGNGAVNLFSTGVRLTARFK